MADRRTFQVEVRAAGKELHGTIVTEGRAASGGRAEVFTPGSITWPSTGVRILAEHRGRELAKAFPHRAPNGEIRVRAAATEAIRAAIDDGKRWMSVEFRALDERTTAGGVREILSAYVDAAALVRLPEYDSTTAEVRRQGRRPRVWL